METERLLQRREDLVHATTRLKEALNEEPTELAIDGVLHRFEFTFELAWKVMKDKLEFMGVVEKTGSPREVIKSAFQYNIIDDGEAWIEMMLSRNMLSHMYDEKQSRDIYSKIKNTYINLLLKLVDAI